MKYIRKRPHLQNRISPWDESTRFETKTASDRVLCCLARKKSLFVYVFLQHCNYHPNQEQRGSPFPFISHARFEPCTAQIGRFVHLCEDYHILSMRLEQIPRCRSPPFLSDFSKKFDIVIIVRPSYKVGEFRSNETELVGLLEKIEE